MLPNLTVKSEFTAVLTGWLPFSSYLERRGLKPDDPDYNAIVAGLTGAAV